MFECPSVLDIVQTLVFTYCCVSLHSLAAKDRLGNPEIDFPIGMVFGDNDFFGTEGADEIVRNNRHFESGKS